MVPAKRGEDGGAGWRRRLLTICFCSFVLSGIGAQDDVRLPPTVIASFTTETMVFTFSELSAGATLSCTATGTPTPEVTWYKNGVLITADDSQTSVGPALAFSVSGSVLRISATNNIATQAYIQCRANNSWGLAVSDVTLVQLAYLDAFPAADVNVINVKWGLGVQVPCVGAPASAPSRAFRWERTNTEKSPNGMLLLQTQRVQVDNEGNLYFANVLLPDSMGPDLLLACIEYNALLVKTAAGSYSQLIVQGIESNTTVYAPDLAFAYSSVSAALVGQTVTLHCFFYGLPTPNVTWSKNGTDIPSNQTSLGGTVLTLVNVQLTDAGQYECSAGLAVHYISITVGIAPIFIATATSPRNINVTQGTDVTFYCAPEATPTADITWYINGDVIVADDTSTQYSISSDSTKLTVSNVCKDCSGVSWTTDLMVVQCNASNSFGYVFAEGYLNVLLQTMITTQPTNTTLEPNDTSVTFTCQATSDPSTPVEIFWLFNNEPVLANNTNNMTTQVSQTFAGAATGSITIDTVDVSYNAEIGTYTCVASNGYSTATASFVLILGNDVTVPTSPLPPSSTTTPLGSTTIAGSTTIEASSTTTTTQASATATTTQASATTTTTQASATTTTSQASATTSTTQASATTTTMPSSATTTTIESSTTQSTPGTTTPALGTSTIIASSTTSAASESSTATIATGTTSSASSTTTVSSSAETSTSETTTTTLGVTTTTSGVTTPAVSTTTPLATATPTQRSVDNTTMLGSTTTTIGSSETTPTSTSTSETAPTSTSTSETTPASASTAESVSTTSIISSTTSGLATTTTTPGVTTPSITATTPGPSTTGATATSIGSSETVPTSTAASATSTTASTPGITSTTTSALSSSTTTTALVTDTPASSTTTVASSTTTTIYGPGTSTIDSSSTTSASATTTPVPSTTTMLSTGTTTIAQSSTTATEQSSTTTTTSPAQSTTSSVTSSSFTSDVTTSSTLSTTQGPSGVLLPPSFTYISLTATVIYIRPQEKLEFNCEASGSPTPVIIWKKNSVQMSISTPAANVKFSSTSTQLVIYPVSTEDAGGYQCLAKNEYGVAVSNVTVVVIAQLAFFAQQTKPIEYQAVEGGPLALPCVGAPQSVPAASFSWVVTSSMQASASVAVVTTNSRVQVDIQGSLYFANTLTIDEYGGSYLACKETNEYFLLARTGAYASISVTKTTTIVASAPTTAFQYISPVGVVLRGQTVELHCFFYGYPTPTILWSKVNDTLPTGRSFSTGPMLTITGVQLSDAGQYTCTGTNTAGFAEQILDLVVGMAPSFASDLLRPHDRNVTQGHNATLRCDPTAHPPADIDWYINGEIVDVTVVLPHVTFSADYREVTITGVCKDCSNPDLMVVQCNASNSFGYVFVEGYLNVLLPTTIVDPPQNQTIEASSKSVTFFCPAVSDPSTPVTVSWFHYKRPISTYHSNVYQEGPDYLTIDTSSSSSIDVAGVYTCVASNGYSVAVAWAVLFADDSATTTPAGPGQTTLPGSTVTTTLYTGTTTEYTGPSTESTTEWIEKSTTTELFTTTSVAPTTTGAPADIRVPPTLIFVSLNATVIYFHPYHTVQLECRASGTPTPEIVWTKNSIKLTASTSAGNVMFSQSNSVLSIYLASSLDAGYYQCSASNQWGVAVSRVSYLQMAVLGFFQPSLPISYRAVVGQSLTVPCLDAAQSVPNATYTWVMTATVRGSASFTIVTPNDRIQIDANGSLCFSNVMTVDEYDGNYLACQEYNAYLDRTRTGSYSVIVAAKAPGLLPTLIAPSPAFIYSSASVALRGQTVTLHCFFNGLPTPAVVWTRSRRLLPVGRHTASGPILTIRDVRLSDAGQYICTGANAAGRAQQSIILGVGVAPSFPSMRLQPHDRNVTQGHSVTFRCDALAVPAVSTPTWYINGASVDVSLVSEQMRFSADYTQLTISDACKDCANHQSGLMVVQCNASNSLGYAFAEGYLNVLLPTAIVMPPRSQELIPYAPVSFTCAAVSDPSTPVSIYWLYDGFVLRTADVGVYQSTLTISTSQLPSGGVALVGTYTCVAFNGYSIAIASAVLVSSNTTLPPSSPPPSVPTSLPFTGVYTGDYSLPTDLTKPSDGTLSSTTTIEMSTTHHVTLPTDLSLPTGLSRPTEGASSSAVTRDLTDLSLPTDFSLPTDVRSSTTAAEQTVSGATSGATSEGPTGSTTTAMPVRDQAVRLPPSLTVTLTSSLAYYSVSASVELQCRAVGTPQPEIFWMKDDQLLSIATAPSNVVFSESNTRLVITAGGASDVGVYQCLASNAWGTAVSNVTRLEMAQQGAFPSALAVTYHVQEGKGLSVPCLGAPTSTPSGTYSWVVTLSQTPGAKQTTLQLSDRVQVDDEGTLYYANVQPRDAQRGRYLACVQSNAFLGSTRTGSYSLLSVTTGLLKPRITIPTPAFLYASSSAVMVGQTVTLHCFFYGLPTPTVVWHKRRSARPLTSVSGVLTLDNVELSDAGEYVCEGLNEAGRGQQTFTLAVGEAPVFSSLKTQPHNQNVTQGHTVTFDCKAKAEPAATVTWYINGIPVNPAALPPKVTLASGGTQLTVADVCKNCPASGQSSDLAVVQCNASNAYGYAFAEGYLNVLLPTTILVPPTDQVLAPGATATFTCLAVSDPSTEVEVIWIHLGVVVHEDDPGYQLSAGHLTVNASATSASRGLRFRDPVSQASLLGRYVCLATNGYSIALAEATLSTQATADNTTSAGPSSVGPSSAGPSSAGPSSAGPSSAGTTMATSNAATEASTVTSQSTTTQPVESSSTESSSQPATSSVETATTPGLSNGASSTNAQRMTDVPTSPSATLPSDLPSPTGTLPSDLPSPSGTIQASDLPSPTGTILPTDLQSPGSTTPTSDSPSSNAPKITDVPSPTGTPQPTDLPSPTETLPSELPSPTGSLPSDLPSSSATIQASDLPSSIETILPSDLPSTTTTIPTSDVSSSNAPKITDVPSPTGTPQPTDLSSPTATLPSELPSPTGTLSSDLPSPTGTILPTDLPNPGSTTLTSDSPSSNAPKITDVPSPTGTPQSSDLSSPTATLLSELPSPTGTLSSDLRSPSVTVLPSDLPNPTGTVQPPLGNSEPESSTPMGSSTTTESTTIPVVSTTTIPVASTTTIPVASTTTTLVSSTTTTAPVTSTTTTPPSTTSPDDQSSTGGNADVQNNPPLGNSSATRNQFSALMVVCVALCAQVFLRR